MSREKIKYLSTNTLDHLVERIYEHLPNYREGNFDDLMNEGGWDIPLTYESDLEPLKGLDPSGKPEAEIENSLLVWQCFHDLSPALACENRIWTRLSHVECLTYSRERWAIEGDDEKAVSGIKKHFFAPTLAGCRDDHSISRLWWNAKIAKILRPEKQRSALELFLAKADYRLSFVERSLMVSRPMIGRGILRLMETDSWVTAQEENFRSIMKAVNLLGSGIVFELYTEDEMDQFMVSCRQRAEHEILKKAA